MSYHVKLYFHQNFKSFIFKVLTIFTLKVECIPTRGRENCVLLMVTSNVTAVKCGPFCILVDKIGQGTELGGSFAYVSYLTNLGLMRYKEV